MDGIHDLGGRAGFGRVDAEADEPVFHADWERRALGVTMAAFAAGFNNGGQFRHSIERMDPLHYLASRYYEHWLTGVATRLVESGRVGIEELEQRSGGPFPLSQPVRTDAAPPEPDPVTAELAVGAAVRVRDAHPPGHTRCPDYVRGKRGTVVRLDGAWSVPDVEAHSERSRLEPTCSVRFEASELWGDDQPGAAVHVDLWASYLEAL
jgi:nitrile hydratase subunit beta